MPNLLTGVSIVFNAKFILKWNIVDLKIQNPFPNGKKHILLFRSRWLVVPYEILQNL